MTPAVDETDAESKLLNDGFPYDLLILDVVIPGPQRPRHLPRGAGAQPGADHHPHG